MPRKIIKPFTVELRKGGRKIKLGTPSWPAEPAFDSAMDDQPNVVWPGLDRPPSLAEDAGHVVEAPAPAKGRILPALDQPAPAIEDPKSRPAGTPRTRPRSVTAGEAPINPERVGGLERGPETAESKAPLLAAPESGYGAEVATTKQSHRHERKRLDRSEFKRGERWKARLPIAAIRSRMRRQ